MGDCTIIVLGASGDLAKRKLLPALYSLVRRKRLTHFALVGAALEDISADEMLARAREHIGDEYEEASFAEFAQRVSYQQLNFKNADDYVALRKHVEKVEHQFNLPGKRLVYLAAAANFFCEITTELAKSQLVTRRDEHEKIWQRIVYEKPFGHNLSSAKEINACIEKYFDEGQIYRIDHYLTKELVANIALIRFTNCVFEPLWNHTYIDQVQIILSETVGVGDRAGYYDHYGSLRDVVQNHMLELLALVAMEPPEKLYGEYIRSQRMHVLKHVEMIDGFFGQYDGYRDETGVKKDSHTDTFSMLYLTVNNARWKGVPFYFKTGKELNKRETVILIKFKAVDCPFTRQCSLESNWLRIEVAPEATFSLTLNAKKPGSTNELVPIDMEFCHSCVFGKRETEAYETLLEEILRGERSVSVRFDEIEQAWKVIDAIDMRKLPLHFYEKGTEGPKEAIETFEKTHSMRWRS